MAVATSTTETPPAEAETELLHPDNFNLTYPKTLSPSAILEFRNCPQSYLFQYLFKLRQPTNKILAKGSMCHEALENLFDLDPSDRTLPILQNLYRVAWNQHRSTDTYKELFADDDPTMQQEIAWGREGLALLENYMQKEDPTVVTRPNPLAREVWVTKRLNYSDHSVLVRGIVDRIDMERNRVLRIIDYKSGKAPDLKYAEWMNEKIRKQSFEQLKMYAVMYGNQKYQSKLDVRFLRLFHLTNVNGEAEYLDLDLGADAAARKEQIAATEEAMVQTFGDIISMIDAGVKEFHGCDRSFCYCHVCRERFVPGSVWTPATP